MRILPVLVLAAIAFPAGAQSEARPRPAGTVPLVEAPPPPPMAETDTALAQGTQVTTRVEGDQTIQEYRLNGKLYMQRVTPKHGKPYVLMDHRGDGTFMRQDHPLDTGIRVPQWVLKEF